MIHVASFFHRDLTLHRNYYRVFDQGCGVIGLSALGTGCSCRCKVWRRRQGFGVMYHPRTLDGRAFPNAEPFFAFGVWCGDKANAGRA